MCFVFAALEEGGSHVVGDVPVPVPAVGVDGNEMDPGEEPLSLDSLTKDDEIRRKHGPD